MARTGKVIAHTREGQGKIGVERLTVVRAGPLHDIGVRQPTADMFADVFPYLSLQGLDTKREENRRGNTMLAHDESHIQSRTRGSHSQRPHDGRSHHRKLVTKE